MRPYTQIIFLYLALHIYKSTGLSFYSLGPVDFLVGFYHPILWGYNSFFLGLIAKLFDLKTIKKNVLDDNAVYMTQWVFLLHIRVQRISICTFFALRKKILTLLKHLDEPTC